VTAVLSKSFFIEHDFSGINSFCGGIALDNSISGPEAFIRTMFLERLPFSTSQRKHWMSAPFEKKQGYESNRFLHISTDEVFVRSVRTGLFTKTHPMRQTAIFRLEGKQ